MKFDISISSRYFNEIIELTQAAIKDKGLMIGHGHIGDGNLHLNCTIKGYDRKELRVQLAEKLEPLVFDYVR